MKRQIYLILRGRIGNQLFMYAFARNIQKYLGELETELIIDDSEVQALNWENSLMKYELPNVRYIHNTSELKKVKWLPKYLLLKVAEKIASLNADYMNRFKREKILKPFLQVFGIYMCENGFMDFKIKRHNRYLLSGYFQSKEYFRDVNEDLIKTFSMCDGLEYPNLEELEKNETVCISVKVEHNVGSSLYAVCGKNYWKEAVDYIISRVENPIFFVCSDDVDYVKNNLIDCSKYKVYFQDKNEPVYKTLAAMSRCKHFIIGNTTFGWWAQYMSKNPKKIVIAPNQWMLVRMPIDIYESNWTLLDVKKDLGDKAL